MLRRHPEKIVIDSLAANTIVVNGDGTVTIQGYGIVDPADVVNCYAACAEDCTPQVTTVTVVIPDSCECPYEWGIYVQCLPCPQSYEVQQTFGAKKFYGYQDPSGATPTANATAAAIAANINADPFACVTASVVGAVITLTEKDCDKTCGFTVTIADASGTVNTTTPHSNGILTAEQIAKLFPIQWGHAGARPSIAYCGQYCVYYMRIRKSCDAQDISAANHYNCHEQEVYFFVNQNLANYVADWETEMLANFDCFDDPTPPQIP